MKHYDLKGQKKKQNNEHPPGGAIASKLALSVPLVWDIRYSSSVGTANTHLLTPGTSPWLTP